MASISFVLFVSFRILPIYCVVQSPNDMTEAAARRSDAAKNTVEAAEQEWQNMHRRISVVANGATSPVMRRQQPVFDKQTLAQGFHVQSERRKSPKFSEEIKQSEQELETLSDEAITGGSGVNDSDIEPVVPSFIILPTIHGGTIGTTRVQLPRDVLLYAACFTTMGLMGIFVLISILNCVVPGREKEDLTVGGNFQPLQLKSIPVQLASPIEMKRESEGRHEVN
eukprot:gnl/MRDRNA2_/MRDRNA2_34604_c0_seq1.p1 gnl/MRDRNA2_/MRDRNA2_34604_c0~~gnl/MRDRNA2_/MRDRNA2_34604_c0_seq1.p1  ORF type:complete len:225 (+),score=45.93 gnl/MRDRNA2_/MRDRNA2_34604_c0_seq1:106-780(+)